MAPEMTKAISFTLKGLIPTDLTLSSFALHDFKTKPSGEFRITFNDDKNITNHAKHIK